MRPRKVGEIARKALKKLDTLSKDEILRLGEELLELGYIETSGIAFNWAWNLRMEFVQSDFPRFERWLKKYVDNWGLSDSLCCGALGVFLMQFPDLVPKTEKWTNSKNRWLRRASAVCLIPLLTQGEELETAFARADALLTDHDDMV